MTDLVRQVLSAYRAIAREHGHGKAITVFVLTGFLILFIGAGVQTNPQQERRFS